MYLLLRLLFLFPLQQFKWEKLFLCTRIFDLISYDQFSFHHEIFQFRRQQNERKLLKFKLICKTFGIQFKFLSFLSLFLSFSLLWVFHLPFKIWINVSLAFWKWCSIIPIENSLLQWWNYSDFCWIHFSYANPIKVFHSFSKRLIWISWKYLFILHFYSWENCIFLVYLHM